MATTSEILAQEAALRDLRTRDAAAKAALRGASPFMVEVRAMVARLEAAETTLRGQAQSAAAALAAVENQQSALDGFGAYSSVEQVMRAQRFAGKSASVDFVKANPACEEAEAIAAWEAAALAATPTIPVQLQSAAALGILYRLNLAAMGLIPSPTWEEQRAWIVATDKSIIMGA